MSESLVEGMTPTSYGDSYKVMSVWMQNRQSYPAWGKLVENEQDDVVHSDIVWTGEPVSLEKEGHILAFIVELSRFAKLYMMQSNAQVVEFSKEVKALLERVMSVIGKRLHIDQTPEYMSMTERIRKDGIEHTFSKANIP